MSYEEKRRPCILILGTIDDPHVERVWSKLRVDSRVDSFVVDYKKPPMVSAFFDEGGNYQLRLDGCLVPDNTILWDRGTIIPGTDLYPIGGQEDVGFIAEEWRTLYKLFCGLYGKNVVNSLESRACRIKPIQQMIASQCGFKTPSTIISNEKRAIVDFCNDKKSLIVKSLSGVRYKPQSEGEFIPQVVVTSRIKRSDIDLALPDEFIYCPHFVQNEIGKIFELRVVVVGKYIFAFRINSQDFKLTEVDWRLGCEILSFNKHDLDAKTKKKIKDFMRKSKLFSGSFDLIVGENDVWFLECNQNGAWGWLDDVLNGKISSAFSDALSEMAWRRLGGSLSRTASR